MEQQADLEIGSPQVVEQLSIGSLVQLVCGLDLDDELAVDDHVHSLVRKLVALVHDTNAYLSPYLMTTVRELTFQSRRVDVFEEPVVKRVVHFKERPDNRPCQSLLDELMSFHGLNIVQSAATASSKHCTTNPNFSRNNPPDPFDPQHPNTLRRRCQPCPDFR
jgi:hypothetical protein